MTEETITETLPPIRYWPALDLTGVDFDPVLAELMREGPVTRIRLPNGEGWAWLVTRHDDVRMVTNDARFSREAGHGAARSPGSPRTSSRCRGAVGFVDPPDHTRLRRAVAAGLHGAQGVERGPRAVPAACWTNWSTRLLAGRPARRPHRGAS